MWCQWMTRLSPCAFLGITCTFPIHLQNDEQFNLTIQIQVSGPASRAATYIETLSCMYSPWAEREIFCEENYMQVNSILYDEDELIRLTLSEASAHTSNTGIVLQFIKFYYI